MFRNDPSPAVWGLAGEGILFFGMSDFLSLAFAMFMGLVSLIAVVVFGVWVASVLSWDTALMGVVSLWLIVGSARWLGRMA